MNNPKLVTAIILLLFINLGLIGYYFLFLKKDKSPYFHPFKINFDVTEESLLQNGYVPFPEDVYILQKSISDTSIAFQIVTKCDKITKSFWNESSTNESMDENFTDYECKVLFPYAKYCIFKLQKLDSLEIVDLIESYGGRISSDWTLNMEPYPEFDIRYENNIHYQGYINIPQSYKKRIKPTYSLHICSFFPLTQQQLKERKENTD